MWRAPVAELWHETDAETVALAVMLRDLIVRQGDDVKPALIAQRLAVERELLITPKSSRASGITIDDRDQDRPQPAELHVLPPRSGSGLSRAALREIEETKAKVMAGRL